MRAAAGCHTTKWPLSGHKLRLMTRISNKQYSKTSHPRQENFPLKVSPHIGASFLQSQKIALLNIILSLAQCLVGLCTEMVRMSLGALHSSGPKRTKPTIFSLEAFLRLSHYNVRLKEGQGFEYWVVFYLTALIFSLKSLTKKQQSVGYNAYHKSQFVTWQRPIVGDASAAFIRPW